MRDIYSGGFDGNDDDILSDIPTVDDYEDLSTIGNDDGYDIMSYQKQADEAKKDNNNDEDGVRIAVRGQNKTTPSRKTYTSTRKPRTMNKKKGTHKKKKRRHSNGCLSKIIYIVIVLSVSIILSVFSVGVAKDIFGVFQTDSSIEITIPKGATGSEVTNILNENNIVEYKWAFDLFQKLKKVALYDGGTYVLNRKTDYNTIIKTLRSEAVREEVSITFPEGYTIEQIFSLLQENGICSVADMKAQMDKVDFKEYKFIEKYPASSDILYKYEGYMFPDTYIFYKNDTPQSVYSKFLVNLNNKLPQELYTRAEEIGMSMHQVLTLASIIQKEANTNEEMNNISSVFHNRLKSRSLSRLQSDTTVWYPYVKDDIPVDKRDEYLQNNKYNTYNIIGLPPGPICSPGIAAIKAALYPSDREYYYFVTDANGKFYYAVTHEQHIINCATAARTGSIGGIDTGNE